MDFSVNFDNERPIYMQLVEQLKIWIISGKIEPGDRIPSIREMAIGLKINPNTIQKGLVELENQGFIYTERTNGKYVTNDSELIEKLKDEYAMTLAKSYFQGMKRIGLGKADSIKYLERISD